MIKEATFLGVGFTLGRMGEEPRLPVARTVSVLGLGFAAGYFASAKNQEPNGEVKEATADLIKSTRAILVDAWLDIKKDMAEVKQAADEKKKQKTEQEPVEGTAVEVTDESEPAVGADEEAAPAASETEAGQQGETP